MLRSLGIFAVALTIGLVPAVATATPQDGASTHTYLLASYKTLHAIVSKWSSVEANVRKLESQYRTECPNVGANSPQSEQEQKLSLEVVGALWATGYDTNARIIQSFVKTVSPLKWSSPVLARIAHKYTTGLRDMIALGVPPLCADVRTWIAGGYKAAPADTDRYDRRVEAIEVKEIPQRLLARYVQPSDRTLLVRVERLVTRYEEIEFSRGQADWNALLEVLALDQ
jgi:hypothetical protein